RGVESAAAGDDCAAAELIGGNGPVETRRSAALRHPDSDIRNAHYGRVLREGERVADDEARAYDEGVREPVDGAVGVEHVAESGDGEQRGDEEESTRHRVYL